MLASVAVFTLVVALGIAGLYAFTVVPFVLALGMAERRGFATGRWAALAVVGVLLAVVLAVVAHRADAPPLLQVLPLVLAFAAPIALYLLSGAEAVGGRAGRHERPL